MRGRRCAERFHLPIRILALLLASLGGFARAACAQDDGAATNWTDTAPAPEPGDARYYLVRAENGCGDGGWGPRTVAACP